MRKADQLRSEVECETQGSVGGVELGLAHPLIGNRIVAPAPDDAGECGDDIDAEPQGLADLADCRARAVADHGGGETGAVAAVFFVNVLDHLLAPLVLEIDIDVGWLVAGSADEALEQDIDARRIDRGDAETIADDRIGGRAASLTQDAALPREAHDVVDGQKIAGIVEPLDQLELVLDQIADFVRGALWKALIGALPGELDEALLRRLSLRNRLFGVFVTQLVETEPAALDDFEGALDGILPAAKEPRHLLRRFQMALGIGRETIAGYSDRAAFANAGQHILQRAPLGHVIKNIVGRDERQTGRLAERGEAGEAPQIVATVEVLSSEIGAALKIRRDASDEIPPPYPPPLVGESRVGV